MEINENVEEVKEVKVEEVEEVKEPVKAVEEKEEIKPVEEPKKRKRRTKKEIEEANARSTEILDPSAKVTRGSIVSGIRSTKIPKQLPSLEYCLQRNYEVIPICFLENPNEIDNGKVIASNLISEYNIIPSHVEGIEFSESALGMVDFGPVLGEHSCLVTPYYKVVKSDNPNYLLKIVLMSKSEIPEGMKVRHIAENFITATGTWMRELSTTLTI